MRPRAALLVRHLAIGVCVIVGATCISTSGAASSASVVQPRSGTRTTSGTLTVRQQTSTTTSSAGLSVALTVTPARAAPGVAVEFTVRLSARSAIGSLGYRLKFADGTSRANVVPQFCRAGPGSPEHETWRIAHRYTRAGVYHVSVSGYANCAPTHVADKLAVVIS